MVWTSETGILDVAVDERRWPPIWKAARGRVVIITSREGCRMPCFKAGIVVLSPGNVDASLEKKTQNEDTKANCMRVSVAGLGNVLRMVLEDVLVRALDIYQVMQRIYNGNLSAPGT